MTCASNEDSDLGGSDAQAEQSSLSAWRNIGPLNTYWAHSEDTDQIVCMLRLIWVFAGRTYHFVVAAQMLLPLWYMVGQGPAVLFFFFFLFYFFFFFFFCMFCVCFSSRLPYLPFLMPHLLGDDWPYWNSVVSAVKIQRRLSVTIGGVLAKYWLTA